MSKIIAIAGMHRSGTSLTASWFLKNGLFIGENLLSGKFDNIKGHFEDLEILKIHENNLSRQGYVSDGLKLKINSPVFLDDIAIKQINELISSRKDIPLWGWKEPRGTLFLSDWKNLNKNLFCFSVYRNYNNVVDSLLRRYRHNLFITNNIKNPQRIIRKLLHPVIEKKLINTFLTSWIIYNKKILDFKKKFPDDCIIININDLHKKDKDILLILKNKTGFSSKNILFNDVFDISLFNKKETPFSFRKELHEKAEKILFEMKKHSF